MEFDWNHYWESEEEYDEMVIGQLKMFEGIQQYFINDGVKSICDVGCGIGLMIFKIAEGYPDKQCVGIDFSERLIKNNKLRYQLPNLKFHFRDLQDIGHDRYDLITCLATLHYVSNPLDAISYLFSRLNSGGKLIVNYPNSFTFDWYSKYCEGDEMLQGRFSVLLSKLNIIHKDQIQEIIDTKVESFWDVIGEEGSEENPMIILTKT